MVRLLGGLARAGAAAALFLLLLALLRFGPVYAEPWGPLSAAAGEALPLFAAAVGLAIVAASCAAGAVAPAPSRGRLRGVLVGTLASAAVLAAVVALRPPAGLAPRLAEDREDLGLLPPGPIDLIGRDLRALPRLRRPSLAWVGELRVPETGMYRLWAEGRGHVRVWIDGWPALSAEGDPLRAEGRLALAPGPHRLEVRLDRDGPGVRLRFGWSPPGRDARLVVPPRALGAAIPRGWWVATDAAALAVSAGLAALALLVPWTVPRTLPEPRRLTAREVAAAAAGLAFVLVVMSWPLATDPAHLGVTDRPDGRLNAWILAWDVHALTREPARLFQAPAFHPLPDALAFSENLLLPAVLSAPFQALGGPVFAYNATLLLSLLISGLGAAALVWRVTSDRWAAFAAGALFAAGAHRWIRLAHLHAQVTLFLPFALLVLDRFWEDRRWRSALLVGLLLALQGYSSVYLGAITAAALGAGIALMLCARLPGRDFVKIAGGLLLAAALLAPVAWPYLRMRSFQGVEFTLAEVENYATTLESYAASGTPLYGAFTQRHLEPDRVQDTLFPGLVPLLLGLAGLAAAPRRYRAAAVAASALAILVSLGPATAFYRFLHEHLVLVRGVRALSRFSLVPVLALCVLTGLFLAGRRRGVVLLALALALLESSHVPLGYGRWEGPGPAARALAARPAGSSPAAVVVLPLGDDDTKAMLEGAAHWRPLVNGDSGFVPRSYARVQELLAGPLDDEGLRFLRAVGTGTVVSRREEPLLPTDPLGAERIYAVPEGESASAVPAGEPVATRWTDRATLDLGGPRPVSRVVFEISDGPWIDEPQVAASLDGAAWTLLPARASLADATVSLLRDPRHGRGQIVFPRTETRYLRLGPRVPARRAALEVGE